MSHLRVSALLANGNNSSVHLNVQMRRLR